MPSPLIGRNSFFARGLNRGELNHGERVSSELADGSQQPMRVRAIEPTAILLDGNHDLAGRQLTFALKLVAIEKSAP